MFRSATLKLTAWYVGILMLISVSFSLVIFQTGTSEVDNRLIRFQTLIQNHLPSSQDEENLRSDQSAQASLALAVRLVYLNLGVLAVGTAASYLLARRTLRPVEEAHEAEVRFVSDASHELRTPLAIMKSEIEASLRDKKSSSKELREILKSNLEEVNNLSKMSETLLKMAKLDKNVPMKSIRLGEVANQAVERLKQPQSRIRVISKKSPFVTANRELIEEAIIILVDNALKYSPDSSQVTVSIRQQGKEASVAVENEGKGISGKELGHIFDRFYRSDRSRTGHDSEKGFGLGLSLAKQIVELHDGYITASSAVNEPTVFTIFLPKRN